MKNSKVFMSMALLGAMVISSCTKEEIKEVRQGAAQTDNRSLASLSTSGWIKDNGEGKDCGGEGSGCYGLDIVIIRPKYQAMKGVTISAGGNKTDVGSLFNSSEMQEISDNMEPAILSMLQSGNYYLDVDYQDAQVIKFYGGQTKPITAQNRAFAFQITKGQ